MKKKQFFSIAEYLELETVAEVKHEYHNGEILAMSGGTSNHSLIGNNIGSSLQVSLRQKGKDCSTFNSDLRVYIDAANTFLYPDASVICGPLEYSEQDENSVVNPLLIIEVLSKSTGNYDRGEKFRKYRTLPSFREYVLIDQNQPIVDVLSRLDDRSWKMVTIIGLDKSIYLNSIDCTIEMSDIYHRVTDLETPNFKLEK